MSPISTKEVDATRAAMRAERVFVLLDVCSGGLVGRVYATTGGATRAADRANTKEGTYRYRVEVVA